MPDRITISVDPATAAALESVRLKSTYIRDLVEAAQRSWAEALEIAASYGWSQGDVLTACHAMMGSWTSMCPSPFLAAEISDHADLAGVEEGATRESVAELARAVQTDPRAQWAILTLTQEFWSGNSRLEHALGRLC